MTEGLTPHLVDLPNGQRLNVYNRTGSGTPVFCVHGLLRVGADFTGLAQAYPGPAFYAPDVRGRGNSTHGPEADYRVDVYVQDMLALLDKLGLEKVHWVGTSMGGMIGMMMAAQHPERVATLTLNDVGPEVSHRGMQRIAKYVGVYPTFATFDEGLAWLRAAYAPFNLTEPELLALAKPSLKTTDGGYILHHDPAIAIPFMALANSPDATVNLWPLFEAITCPILVIRGQYSDILPAEVMAAMAQRAKTPCQTFTEPDVGHAPMLTKPATVAAIHHFHQTYA